MCQCIPLDVMDPLRGSHRNFIEKAKEESFKSSMCHRHGACLVYRNKIISFGYNHMHAGSKKSQVYDECSDKYSIYSTHAEVSAIKEFLRLGKRKGYGKNILKYCVLYVVRIGKESMDYPIKMSKPCDNCYNFINKYGIKKIYWSVDEIEY